MYANGICSMPGQQSNITPVCAALRTLAVTPLSHNSTPAFAHVLLFLSQILGEPNIDETLLR